MFYGVLMRFHVRWMQSERWPLFCGMAIGLLISLPLAVALIRAKIPEPVVSLLGSAVGAAAAVAGAFWVAEHQIMKQRRNAAAFVAALFWPVADFLGELARAYGSPSSTDPGDSDDEPDRMEPYRWEEIRSLAQLVIEHYESLQRRHPRLDAAIYLLGPEQMETALSLEWELDYAINDTVKPVLQRAADQATGLSPSAASWRTRKDLTVFNAEVTRLMKDLDGAAL